MESKQSSFAAGVAILSLSALIGKLLSALYRIPYQNITGDEGMYVYQQVYPLYSVLLLLATAGFPLVISKLVSERDGYGAYRVFTISIITLGVTGLLFFMLLFWGAETIADWMGNRELLTLPIQSVSFSFLLIPVLSVIRGYFQGRQNMVPTAASQIVEQVIRVTTILLLAWLCMELGLGYQYVGAGAVLGASTGGLAALVVLLFYWRKRSDSGSVASTATSPIEPARVIVKKLIALSLPICLAALVYPLFGLVDSFTIANRLTMSGVVEESAIVLKGVFDRGQPLIQFASFFATAISLSLVPAISSAWTKEKRQETMERAEMALRMTWLLGLPASVGLALLAVPMNVMFFEDSLGSDALRILAFTPLFSTLVITSSAILQGVGKVYQPVWHLLLGVVCKGLLNWLLIPGWGIQGAAVATVLSYGLVAGSNLLAVRVSPPTWQRMGSILLAVVSLALGVTLVMYPMHWLTDLWFPYRLAMTITSLGTVLVGIVIYMWAIFRFGVIHRNEVEQIPKLKKWVLPFLDKWGFIRS